MRYADKFSDRYQMRTDNSVKWRNHVGIAIVHRGDFRVDLSLLQIGLGVIPRRRGLIERRLRHDLPRDEIRLTLEGLSACFSVACAPASAACA